MMLNDPRLGPSLNSVVPVVPLDLIYTRMCPPYVIDLAKYGIVGRDESLILSCQRRGLIRQCTHTQVQTLILIPVGITEFVIAFRGHREQMSFQVPSFSVSRNIIAAIVQVKIWSRTAAGHITTHVMHLC